jgi:predicted SAM-dependent methyltransferase
METDVPAQPGGPISRYIDAQIPPTYARSRLGRLVPAGLRPVVRDALHGARVWVGIRLSRRNTQPLSVQPRRLHLGSAEVYKRGWINIDQHGAQVDFVWDLRRPLPLPPGSVEAIFHEHLLEHLPAAEGLSLTRECHRLLRPGGILRIGVPDFGRYARGYVNGDGFIAGIRPEVPTPLFALAEVTYDYGHRSLWDEATLVGLLAEVGFSARGCAFGESALEEAPDSEHRRDETLYVEAVKADQP